MPTYPLSILAYWERGAGVWVRRWEGDCEDLTLPAVIAMCPPSPDATAGELREASSGAVLWRWGTRFVGSRGWVSRG